MVDVESIGLRLSGLEQKNVVVFMELEELIALYASVATRVDNPQTHLISDALYVMVVHGSFFLILDYILRNSFKFVHTCLYVICMHCTSVYRQIMCGCFG